MTRALGKHFQLYKCFSVFFLFKDFTSCVCDVSEFDPVGDGKQIKETSGTVKKDGLNDASGNRRWGAAYGSLSLQMTSVSNDHCVLNKKSFNVQSYSQIFESVLFHNCL